MRLRVARASHTLASVSNTPRNVEGDGTSLEDITSRISAEMEARRVSLDSLSEMTGLPVDTLRFQLQESPIHLTLLTTLRIAKALNVPTAALAEAA